MSPKSIPAFKVFGLPVSRVTIGIVRNGNLYSQALVRDDSGKNLAPVISGSETDGTDAQDPQNNPTPVS